MADVLRGYGRLFVVLSDVHLDSPIVMEKLRVVLSGYAMMETPPACFVCLAVHVDLKMNADFCAVLRY